MSLLTLEKLQALMIDKGLIIRAIPHTYTGLYDLNDRNLKMFCERDNYISHRTLVPLGFYREMLEVTFSNKFAEKFLIEAYRDESGSIRFNIKRMFNTLEEAIKFAEESL